LESERARRLRELFAELRGMAADAREVRLYGLSSSDAAMALELRALLGADATASGDALLPPAPHLAEQLEVLALRAGIGNAERRPPAERERDPLIGREFDDFTIVRSIGWGGMGTVYLARQRRPARTVAIKMMRGSLRSQASLRRFEHEAEALAKMQHPGIASIFQVGSYDDGTGAVPYLAMEYIPDAIAINDFVAREALDIQAILTLFVEVCAAVHHAHQRGVVHRDLKPSNILIDLEGRPKIIDFGVARSLESGDGMTTLHTNARQLIGTLRYMSPEQCGEADEVDGRSDVYALGVVLYELLTGSAPYETDGRPIHEAVRAIREEPPGRPSALRRLVRGDLETILLTALAKDRSRRYQSVEGLARDIERRLRGEPIAARPPSILYQVSLFARRHRGLTAGLLGVLVSLVVTVLVVSLALMRTLDAERRMSVALKDSETRTERLNLVAASSAAASGDSAALRLHLDAISPERRGWMWHYLDARSDQSLAVLLNGIGDMADLTWLREPSVAWSSDGERIVGTCSDRLVRVWDSVSGELLHAMAGHEAQVTRAAFSPDGRRIVSVSVDHTARVWDTASGRLVSVLAGHEERVLFAAFDPSGSIVATASQDATARLWDAESGRELRVLRGHDGKSGTWYVNWLAFSPDGGRIATAGGDGTARIWDVSSGSEIAVCRGHANHVDTVEFSPDGERLLTGSDDSTARLWNGTTGEFVAALAGHSHYVHRARFAERGESIATISFDGVACVWDAATGSLRWSLKNSGAKLTTAAFTPEADRLVTSSEDGTVAIWDVATGARLAAMRGHTSGVTDISLSPDGEHAASASDDGTIRLWDVRAVDQEFGSHVSGAVADRVPLGDVLTQERDRVTTGIAFCGESRDKLVSASESGAIAIWSLATGRCLARADIDRIRSMALAVSPDGLEFLTAHVDGSLRLWKVDTCVATHHIETQGGTIMAATLIDAPEGPANRVALALTTAGVLLRWDVRTGEVTRVRDTGLTGASAARWFHPMFLAVAKGTDVHLLDPETGEPQSVLHGFGGVPQGLALSSDGQRLLSANSNGTVCVSSPVEAKWTVMFRGHSGSVAGGSFLDGDRAVVTGGQDGGLRVWDARTGEEVLRLLDTASGASVPETHPGGRVIACCVASGVVRMFSRVAYRERLLEHLGNDGRGTEVLNAIASLRGRGSTWTDVANVIRNWPVADRERREFALDLVRLLAERDRRSGSYRSKQSVRSGHIVDTSVRALGEVRSRGELSGLVSIPLPP
jgi:WD40 repeat protein/serine/threonine protein kinase